MWGRHVCDVYLTKPSHLGQRSEPCEHCGWVSEVRALKDIPFYVEPRNPDALEWIGAVPPLSNAG
jgi:hypothetical protein